MSPRPRVSECQLNASSYETLAEPNDVRFLNRTYLDTSQVRR